jgi:hypothetical protein
MLVTGNRGDELSGLFNIEDNQMSSSLPRQMNILSWVL